MVRVDGGMILFCINSILLGCWAIKSYTYAMSKDISSQESLPPSRRVPIIDRTIEFFRLEAAGGVLLILASVLALILANSPMAGSYNYIFNELQFRIGFSDLAGFDFELRKDVLHWINDGLMGVFFLLVGLEIKREMLVGHLNTRAKAILPIAAAVGGMVLPALVYVWVNSGDGNTMNGWAIPCATDIAFALCILTLLGSRVPVELKVLLTAVAIIDDLGAILIIAFFYTAHLHLYAFLFALIPLMGLFLLNRAGYVHRGAYILLGIILWLAVLKSGVHATMAGVVTALFIPVRTADDRRSPAQRLEADLHPWVVYLILPLFGFANAGVSFSGMGWQSLAEPVTLGIILGLVVGKQIGIFAAVWIAIKAGLCRMPDNVTWAQIYGMAILCGIGFTMSLFIGGLAFTGGDLQAEVRLGVLTGSVLSAFAGYILLKSTTGKAGTS